MRTIPNKLDETYDLVMERMQDQNDDDADLARRILSWLTYSGRPLAVVELQYALAIDRATGEVDPEDLIGQDTILSVCGGIVTTERESSMVRFIHYTTQEYFERTGELYFSNTKHSLTETCLACLHGDKSARTGSAGPFFSYVAHYWGTHARGVDEKHFERRIVDFLSDNTAVIAAANMLVNTSLRQPNVQYGVHVAAYFGLAHILTRLLEKGENSEQLNGDGQSALHIATFRNQKECVRVLLEQDLNCGLSLSRDWKIVHISASLGSLDLAEEVKAKDESLFAKLDPIAAVCHGWTALHRAAFRGHAAMVDFLLKNGMSAECADIQGSTPLHIAARICQASVIQALVKHGANINRSTNHGYTPVHLAVYFDEKTMTQGSTRKQECLQLLLALGADINIKTKSGATPLHLATLRDDEDTSKMLLDHAARLNIRLDNPSVLSLMTSAPEKGDTLLGASIGLDRSSVSSVTEASLSRSMEVRKRKLQRFEDCINLGHFETFLELDDEDSPHLSYIVYGQSIQEMWITISRIRELW
jgi:ankyrin repeat protein